MWISGIKESVFCGRVLIVSSFCLILLVNGDNEGEDGSTGVVSHMQKSRSQKNKRVKESINYGRLPPHPLPQLLQQQQLEEQQHHHHNPLYDQIAQESDFQQDDISGGGSGTGLRSSSFKGQGVNDGHEYLAYGMKLNPSPNKQLMMSSSIQDVIKARNPRADSNYLRNYQYQPRPRELQASSGWGDNGRQLSSFSLSNLQTAASDYAFGDGTDDNSVAAGHQHGHSQGWGWGHQQQSHGHGKDCNSALGLLGVLGLASYLQNVLRQMATTTAPTAGRKRRALDAADAENKGGIPGIDLTTQLFPLLVSMSHAKDGKVPFKCGLRPYCIANSILSRRLGEISRPVCDELGKIMISSIESNVSLKPKWRRVKALRDLKLAAKVGEKKKNCFKLFPHCPQLDDESFLQMSNSTSSSFNLGGLMGMPFSF